MIFLKKVSVILALLFITIGANAATVQSQAVSITRESGGSIQTTLGHGIVLNENSSLSREWITIHDASMPADLEGTVGIITIFDEGRVSGSFKYWANYTVKAKEDISAVDVHFLIFDIWGTHIRTLSASELADIDGGTSKNFSGKWNLFSENEASEYYASIAYIARVRTKAGRVIEGNRNTVLAEAKKFSNKFTEEDLEPKREKK